MNKQTVQLGVLSVFNIGISFLFQWILITTLGPGAQTDALFAGMTLPQLVLTVISVSLTNVLVPLLAGESEEDMHRDAWAFLILIGAMFSAVAVALFISAHLWVPLTVPGFSNKSKELTIELTRIQLVGMVFAAINGVQWAAFYAKHQFRRAEIAPIAANAIAAGALLVALPRFGIQSAAWALVARAALQTVFLSPAMGKPLWPKLKTQAVVIAWRRLRPLLAGSLYYKTDFLVDRYLLSLAGPGVLSLYYLGQQLLLAASQIVNKAVAAPLATNFTVLFKSSGIDGFRQLYKSKFREMLVIGIVGFLVLLIAGQEILSRLVGYGSITPGNVKTLWLIMILMSGQFIVSGLASVMTAAFYSVGDTKSPTITGTAAYTIGLFLKIFMFRAAGYYGLASAVSIYYLISLSMMFLYLRKKHEI